MIKRIVGRILPERIVGGGRHCGQLLRSRGRSVGSGNSEIVVEVLRQFDRAGSGPGTGTAVHDILHFVTFPAEVVLRVGPVPVEGVSGFLGCEVSESDVRY